MFWRDPDYVRAYYSEDVDALRSVQPPEVVRLGSTTKVEFEAGMDVPEWAWGEDDLDSDDELEWCWHDGHWIMTFIEDQRLLAGDFSEIKADAG